jgi:hypothetical protein
MECAGSKYSYNLRSLVRRLFKKRRALFLCALTHLYFLRIFQVSISYWENSTRSCVSTACHFRMYVYSASLFFIFSAARLAFSGLNLTSCSSMRNLVMVRQISRVRGRTSALAQLAWLSSLDILSLSPGI